MPSGRPSGMFDMTGRGLAQIENPSQVMLEGQGLVTLKIKHGVHDKMRIRDSDSSAAGRSAGQCSDSPADLSLIHIYGRLHRSL